MNIEWRNKWMNEQRNGSVWNLFWLRSEVEIQLYFFLMFSQWSQHHVSLLFTIFSTSNSCCIWIFFFSFCFLPPSHLICPSLLTWCPLSPHLALPHTSQQGPNACWLCLISCAPGCSPQEWSQWLIPSASSWPSVLGSIFYLSPLCCWCVSLFT